jgi:hypothetical protein
LTLISFLVPFLLLCSSLFSFGLGCAVAPALYRAIAILI